MATTVDDCIARAGRWRDEVGRLREIVVATGLDEALNRPGPCYLRYGPDLGNRYRS